MIILIDAYLKLPISSSSNQPKTTYAPGDDCDANCCASIPANEGPLLEWGMRSDQGTYYTRSVCFSDLARRTRDETLCRYVRRRYSFLADGSYYSRRNCVKRIRQDAADRAAPKLNPDVIAIPLDIDKEISGPSLDLILTLKPPKIDGQYALSVLISFDYQPLQKYFAISGSFNPTNAPWGQEKYERYHASAYWIYTIRAGQSSLRVPLDLSSYYGRYGEQILREIALDKPVKAAITLQALDFSDGSIAKTEADIGTDYGQHIPYRKRLEVFLNETPQANSIQENSEGKQ